MAVSKRSKKTAEVSIDPKLIYQPDSSVDLEIGLIVYQSDDGRYLPITPDIIANTAKSFAGIVYSFEGPNYFYLKQSPGPLMYRYPLTKEYFNLDSNGRVLEEEPNPALIPGEFGDILYLSNSEPGKLAGESGDASGIIVGVKQRYGWLYQPEQKGCVAGRVNSTGEGCAITSIDSIDCENGELVVNITKGYVHGTYSS